MPTQKRFSLKTLLLAVTILCLWLGTLTVLYRWAAPHDSWKASDLQIRLWVYMYGFHIFLSAIICRSAILACTRSSSIKGPLASFVFLVLVFLAGLAPVLLITYLVCAT